MLILGETPHIYFFFYSSDAKCLDTTRRQCDDIVAVGLVITGWW